MFCLFVFLYINIEFIASYKIFGFISKISKIMLLNTVKKSMKGPVKIFFGQSKIHVRF